MTNFTGGSLLVALVVLSVSGHARGSTSSEVTTCSEDDSSVLLSARRASAKTARGDLRATFAIREQSLSTAGLHTSLRRQDFEVREKATYTELVDSLEPFTEALSQALGDTSRTHFVGMQAPDFPAKRPGIHDASEELEHVPYKQFYDIVDEKYRGGRFLSYLSRGPLRPESYDSVPCGCNENLGDPDPQTVPQDVCDGNVIANSLDSPLEHSTSFSSSPRKDLVVLLNFAQAGYWGHMVDNGLPRVTIAADAARKAGYNLTVLIPEANVVYDWGSLHQVKEFVETVFGGKLVVPGMSEDQLPSHCQGGAESSLRGAEQGGVCRFFFSCGLPSFHVLVRRRMHEMAHEALDRHMSPTTKSQYHGLFINRGAGAHNAKGDAFAPALVEQLKATNQWDVLEDPGEMGLMELGAQVRGHRHLMGVEGSNGYHLIWLRGRLGEKERTLAMDSKRPAYLELMPTSRIVYEQWLWSHAIGLDYKALLFNPGDTDPAPFISAASEVM